MKRLRLERPTSACDAIYNEKYVEWYYLRKGDPGVGVGIMKHALAWVVVVFAGVVGVSAGTVRGQATKPATEPVDGLTSGLREKELKLANDSTRVAAWRLAPADRPDDVVCFALASATADDLARLVELLGAASDDVRPAYIVLDPGAGPVLPDPPRRGPAARPAVVFSVGNYARWEQWLKANPRGRRKHPECPRIRPPTLTIFVGHPVVDLNKLNLPAALRVEPAYSDEFQEANAKDETVQRIERFVAGHLAKHEADRRMVRLTVELDRYLGYADGMALEPREDEAEVEKDLDNRCFGFRFKVIGPKRFAGRIIGAHHDGLLGAGSPRSYANKGNRYYLRVSEACVGRNLICSLDIDLELIGPAPRDKK